MTYFFILLSICSFDLYDYLADGSVCLATLLRKYIFSLCPSPSALNMTLCIEFASREYLLVFLVIIIRLRYFTSQAESSFVFPNECMYLLKQSNLSN